MSLKAKCPICRRVTTHGEENFPFCSERCKDVDLGNWASEEYKIPGERVDQLPGRSEEDADDETRSR
jgi:endogenous inhibitor of DNA gyrase (YacG/DUF329 family)